MSYKLEVPNTHFVSVSEVEVPGNIMFLSKILWNWCERIKEWRINSEETWLMLNELSRGMEVTNVGTYYKLILTETEHKYADSW